MKILPEIVAQHGFTPEEYTRLLDIIGREPSMVELGIFSVMWSEHCSYKSTRFHLKNLPTTGKQVICGPGENAGIISIGDDDAIVFKMESHNHPSFIEPFHGSATGVGGIMRDVFTMGARPICNLNALRFGDIKHPKTRHLLEGVVSGIGGYGNPMGVPTVAGEVNFHPSYNQNILVNAMCVGLVDKNKIFYSAAAVVGGDVVYAGSKTGRDGIHGATMSSAEFDENTEEKRPTVQVGEKKVMEACLELMQQDAILAIQDMGAAGLTCSSIEMADKGDTGIEINLDFVPQREPNMSGYEIMLSESQERMLMVLKPEKTALAKAIFDKWEIDFAVIGKITDSKRLVITQHGETLADLPITQLSSSAPLYERPYIKTPARPKANVARAATSQQLLDDLAKLLALPDICSKKYIYQQYDYKVGNDTISTGGDAAVVRIHGKKKAIAVKADCTPRYVYADPYLGAMAAVCENYRNISATGATPLAITNCLNFGAPTKPEVMGQIVGSLEGMSEACKALDYPVVSGNVSLYNETSGNSIYPTPAIGGVGLIDDYEKHITIPFKAQDEVIIRIGDMGGDLGGSIYLQQIVGDTATYSIPAIHLDEEKKNADFIRFANSQGWISACHDVSDGGQLTAVAEMAIASNIGAKLDIAQDSGRAFGEEQSRYIITASPENAEHILQKAPELGVAALVIGATGGDAICIGDSCTKVADLASIYYGALEKGLAAA
jgi:phosphoribosylformylglycinamidine synthase subunit PurL